MSNTGKGAPTGAPFSLETVTPEEAHKLLKAATTPEQAMAIWELAVDREGDWRAVRLEAEKRHGELLGKAKTGRPKGNVTSSNVSSGAARVAKHRARKVAAVPQDVYDDYIKNDPAPTREGLLRKANPAKPAAAAKPKAKTAVNPNLQENEDVLAWIGKRKKAGQSRDQIVASAAAGENGWPLNGTPLPQNTVDIAVAILVDRGVLPPRTPRKGSTWGGRRKRKVYDQIREDGDTKLRRLRIDIADGVRKLEHMVLPDDIGLNEESQDDIDALFDDLVVLRDWVATSLTATKACMGDRKKQEKLQKLRDLANNHATEPGERRNALAAIEILQAKARAEMGST